ncbi:MAG: ribonuclease E activity regulator RraA [Zoogloeaceae bacterium]|jgi:regulator of ribonuclease activity A|nr:ribonuclease E activity regulator RraA [Zoogloeaceae bacterium]
MTFATADLCDRHEEALRAGTLRVLAPMFRSFGGCAAFHGRIATLKLFEDNSYVRKALAQPGEGRVLVIDGGGSLRRALVGDQLAALGVENGWAGMVVYGCIRDAAAIRAMNIGVLALATHPQKTDKKNVGEADVPVSFGGLTFHAGEWLYADDDGVLVAANALE